MLDLIQKGASQMSGGTTFFGKRRFALSRYVAVFLMATLVLFGCGKPEKKNLPSELNLNKNTVSRPEPKRPRPEERSATNEEGSDSGQGGSTEPSGSRSEDNSGNGSGSDDAEAGDDSGSSGGASGDGGSGNDSGTSSGSPSGDGSKSNAGSGVEGESRSGSLPGRGSGGSNMSVAEAQKSAQWQLDRARRALDKGDLAEAATAASAAYAASSLHAESDGVCREIQKQAAAVIESMSRGQSRRQNVKLFQ